MKSPLLPHPDRLLIGGDWTPATVRGAERTDLRG